MSNKTNKKINSIPYIKFMQQAYSEQAYQDMTFQEAVYSAVTADGKTWGSGSGGSYYPAPAPPASHLSWHPESAPDEVKKHPMDWRPLCHGVSAPELLTIVGYSITPDVNRVSCKKCWALYVSGDFTGSLSPKTPPPVEIELA